MHLWQTNNKLTSFFCLHRALARAWNKLEYKQSHILMLRKQPTLKWRPFKSIEIFGGEKADCFNRWQERKYTKLSYHWNMILPYSLAISELFPTASASATILSLNARLHDVRRAFGMITDWQWTTIDTGLLKTGLWTRNVHMIKPWIQFYSFDRITLNSA